MIITHPIPNLGEVVRTIVLRTEGPPERQPRNVGDHTVTYGYGYTFIQRAENGTWSKTTTLDDDLAAIGITLTQTETAQLDSIVEALNYNNTALADQRIAQFRTDWRYVDLTDAEAQTLYDRVIGRKSDEIQQRFRTHLKTTNGNQLFQALQNTTEMAVLLDMAYNGGAGLIGRKLTNALWNDNRAEAWFEIRYNSNNGDSRGPGIAKRRFLESEMFGLYDNPANVTLTDAQQVYRMLEKHRADIGVYEAKYGIGFDGTRGTELDGNGRTAWEAAKADYRTIIDTYLSDRVIDTIESSLNPAKNAILADLRIQYASNSDLTAKLQDNSFKSTDIYLNPAKPTDASRVSAMHVSLLSINENSLLIGMDQTDILYGGNGNDVLIGEAGDDVLSGGKGDDVLIGGAGNDTLNGGAGNDTMVGGAGLDTYYVDGNDRIIDSDGKGIILGKDGKAIAGAFIKQDDGSYQWAKDTQVTATKNSPLTIALPDGSTVVIEDYINEGDFGINLLDAPVDPTTTNSIIGDLQPILSNGQLQYDSLGNVITNSNQSPDREDMLYDSAGNDRIEAKGGNDTIWANNGGNDWLLGGTGNDEIHFGGDGVGFREAL